MIDDPQFGTRLHALEVRVRRIENQLAQEAPCNESAVSSAACCAGAGCTVGTGTTRIPTHTQADGVDSAQKPTESVSSAGDGGDCGHSATSPVCAAAVAAFDPDAVERHKFTSIYEVSGKREHTHIMECVDAADYDQLHFMYNESEAARAEQMRTIEVLAAEVRAWREAHDSDPIKYSEAMSKACVACANTNAHATARRLVEGEQHEH